MAGAGVESQDGELRVVGFELRCRRDKLRHGWLEGDRGGVDEAIGLNNANLRPRSGTVSATLEV